MPESERGSRLAVFRRQAVAFLKLATPLFVSRAGIATMTIVDGVMVSQHASGQLAYLGLADGTLGRLTDVLVAFVLGGLAVVAVAMGSGNLEGAGRVWRRTVPFALGIGAIGTVVGLAGGPIFRLAGQGPALATGAGVVAIILGASVPAALVALATAIFLESIGRPVAVAVAVVIANVLNAVFNWLLIGGHGAVPALGATGSALSTALVRLLLALALAGYALSMRGHATFGLGFGAAAARPTAAPPPWREQVGLGASAAGVAAAMNALAVWPTLFGGWLGAPVLAATTAAFTSIGIPMLMGIGMADATAIQVASARGARSGATASVLVTNACVAFVPLALVTAAFVFAPGPLAAIFTRDPVAAGRLASLLPLAGAIMLLDAFGIMLTAALRGLGDMGGAVAIPVAFMALMVPLAFALGFADHLGAVGIFIAIAATSAGRLIGLALRFALRASADTVAARRVEPGDFGGRRIA